MIKLILYLVLLGVVAQSHTTRICWKISPDKYTTEFYACGYHGNVPPTGYLNVNGILYPFANIITPEQVPNDVQCTSCDWGQNIDSCQTVNIDGLSNGDNVVSTSCTTIIECPGCTFNTLQISGINTNPCRPDLSPPIINCPDYLTLYANNNCQATIPDLSLNITTCDNCGGALRVIQTLPFGTNVTIGEYPTNVTVYDSSGNMANCTVPIDVIDNTPPHAVPYNAMPTATPSMLWPPNKRMVNVVITYPISTDNCTPNPICNITNVIVDDSPSPQFATSYNIVSNSLVQLRADKSGNGSGRTYIIVITCADDSGKQFEYAVSVPVSHENN